MRKIKFSALVTLILIFGTVIFFYKDLPYGFFQQDEWYIFGKILLHGPGYAWAKIPAFELLPRLLARFFIYLLFSLFGTNAFWYGVVSLLLHLLNVFLIWLFLKRFSRSWTVATVAAFFFGVNSVGSQAVTWFADFPGTLPSTAFVLLTLLFYLLFNETQKQKWLVASASSFVMAVFFKEGALFLIFFMPVFDLMLQRDILLISKEFLRNLRVALRRTWFFCVFGGVIILKMVWGLFTLESETMRFVFGPGAFFKFLLNLVTYPTEGIVQLFFPPPFIFTFASLLMSTWFPWMSSRISMDVISQSIGGEVVSLVMGLIVWMITIFTVISLWSNKKWGKAVRQVFLASCFLALSFIPYVVINKPDAYLESRYYYIPVIGAGWLLGIIVANLYLLFHGVLKMLIVPFMIVLLTIHLKFLDQNITKLVKISETRRSFLEQILREYPRLGNQTIFYFVSEGNSHSTSSPNRTGFPFQSGLGYTLMVSYSKKGELTPLFFNNDFLWELGSQGYQEINGKGFGYFHNISDLEKVVYERNLSPEDVIVYDWDEKQQRLKNMTSVRVKEIFTKGVRLAKKVGWKVTPYVLKERADLMTDDSPETFWSNEEGYKSGQEMKIDLGGLNQLTGIILTYPTDNYVNMVGAGYQIDVSQNEKKWVTVFVENPIYQGEKVAMFFNPISGRYLRIIQLGKHAVAYWSIAEIEIFRNFVDEN